MTHKSVPLASNLTTFQTDVIEKAFIYQ